MEYSDNESGSDCEVIDDILGPEDLFNDEAEESEIRSDHEESKDKPKKDSSWKVEKKIKQSRIVRNPRVILNFDTLRGRNGLSALKKLFKNFKFKGNGHEKEDLSKVMRILQQWMCYQLCPSYSFESCMLWLEALGKKRVVQTLMKKYRLGMDDWSGNKSDGEDIVIAEGNMDISHKRNKNEFDALLNEEIAGSKSDDELSQSEVIQTQNEIWQSTQKETEITLTPEQFERIARNRKLAEEKKLQRMNAQ